MSEIANEKVKIVFVLPDMPGGGTERVVANLANKYVQMDYPVDILLFAGSTVAYDLDSRVGIVYAGQESGGNPVERVKRLFNMRAYYKRNKGCYIFAFSNMGCVFSVIAAAGIPHKMLVSERNDPRMVPFKHKVVRNWAYAKADRLVFQTPEVLEMFSEKIKDKSEVIANPLSENIPEPFVGERSKRVVNVARLQPQKNHSLLLSAFAEFKKSHDDYTLEIYGKGDLENDLKEKAKCLGVEKSVIFHGFSSNVQQEIRNAAMFVLSSSYEGISNSMAEAMAMGIPTISTDCPVGGSRMYIHDGINGILTPVGDINAMVSAMCKVADDGNLVNEMSKNAVEVRNKYSVDNIANKFLKVANII